jgi:alkylation response protein AidB-like acyl-CoA dehydrogenase
MDLGLSEVQQMLKSSAQEFLSQECPLTLVREMEDDAQGYTEQLWRQLVALGWTGLAFPEQYGGTGGSFLDLAVLLEEMGRNLVPGPFFATVVLGGLSVLDAGTDAQKQEILTGICSGDLKMTLALTEPSATYEAWGIETTAQQEGDNFVINGTKLFVADAHVADIMIVAARTSPITSEGDPSQGITLFLVPGNSQGLTINPLRTISSDRQSEVSFSGVSVPAASVLGQVGSGWPVVHRSLQRAIAGKCLEMLGGADAVLEMTLEYVKQRTQFGRAIGTFQAVQHHCANMATDLEGSRNIIYQAAWQIAEGGDQMSEGASVSGSVSMAKAWISGAYHRICESAHQCHGAIGFTKEHDLQLFTRRAKALELTYGDANFHKEFALQSLG